MGGGTAYVSRQGLSQSPIDAWALEIRDYLLGRLSSKARIEGLKAPQQTKLTHPPVRRWWMFEGKQYATLGGPLAQHWDAVVRSAWRLDETFNPRLRLSDRPDGVVDWGQTLARGPRHLLPEYVVRSSCIGLDEEERSALLGWARWIADEWAEYARSVGIEQRVEWRNFAVDVQGPFPIERLRRWAHTARRSRWPLLRGVVAESLRPALEPEELDRIPLPSDETKLFELLCLVRIARCVAPPPCELRWLNAEMSNNTISLDGVRCHYQQALNRDIVLATQEFAGSLGTAVAAFQVRVPQFVDLAFDFDDRRAGLDGLIVEAKSGSQQYEHTVAQLRTYRAARPRRPGSRYLVWGIVEKPERLEATFDQITQVLAAARAAEDVWLFSSADAIRAVLHAVFGDQSFRGNAMW